MYSMRSSTAYRWGLATAAGTALFLLWGIGAMGVIGTEGDRADMLFLGVVAIGIAAALAARFRAEGMVRAMLLAAAATLLVGVIAILLGKHDEPNTSVIEILGLTGMFASLFAASAWLFRSAAQAGRTATSRA